MDIRFSIRYRPRITKLNFLFRLNSEDSQTCKYRRILAEKIILRREKYCKYDGLHKGSKAEPMSVCVTSKCNYFTTITLKDGWSTI